MEYFRNNDPQSYLNERIGRARRTFLHMHILKLRPLWLSGDDFIEDESILVLQHLLNASIDKCMQDGLKVRSALSVESNLKETCLHSLFALSPCNDRYIHLIMDFCENHFEKDYWVELLCNLNSFGATPLHSLAGSVALRNTIQRVIKSIDVKYQRQHPLLIRDNDGELPLHWAAAKTIQEDFCDLDLYFGCEDDSELYFELCGTVFQENFNGQLPIVALLHSYLEDDDHLHKYLRDKTIKSTDDCPEIRFQAFLCSCTLFEGIDISDLKFDSVRFQNFYEKFKVLLSAAVYHLIHNQVRHNRLQNKKIPTLPTHIAASIPNYPMFALQLPLLLNSKSICELDEHRCIPLHYAVRSFTNDFSDHRSCQYRNLYWKNGVLESRSMVQYLVDSAPNTVFMRDSDGRLPIHLASLYGDYELTISPLLRLNSAFHIREIDPVTGLYPFMMAATAIGPSLNVIYKLILLEPSLVYPLYTFPNT